jgi:hypothetical protein
MSPAAMEGLDLPPDGRLPGDLGGVPIAAAALNSQMGMIINSGYENTC